MASSYIKKAVNPKTLKRIAAATYEIFKQVDADVIVARGLSGSLVAAAVGAVYGTPFGIVRKPNEGSHSSEVIETLAYGVQYSKWLIVDDFVVSGHTLNTIAVAVKEEADSSNMEWGKCVGIVLYNSYNHDEEFTFDDESTAPFFRIDLDSPPVL